MNAQYKVMQSDDGEGVVHALFSVYGSGDFVDDIADFGMFDAYVNKPLNIPVVDAHSDKTKDILAVVKQIYEIGRAALPAETLAEHPTSTGGAVAVMQFVIEDADGLSAFRKAKRGALKFSFRYRPDEWDYIERDGKEYRHLLRVTLAEVTTTPIPAHTGTAVLAAKSKGKAKAAPPVDAMLASIDKSLRELDALAAKARPDAPEVKTAAVRDAAPVTGLAAEEKARALRMQTGTADQEAEEWDALCDWFDEQRDKIIHIVCDDVDGKRDAVKYQKLTTVYNRSAGGMVSGGALESAVGAFVQSIKAQHKHDVEEDQARRRLLRERLADDVELTEADRAARLAILADAQKRAYLIQPETLDRLRREVEYSFAPRRERVEHERRFEDVLRAARDKLIEMVKRAHGGQGQRRALKVWHDLGGRLDETGLNTFGRELQAAGLIDGEARTEVTAGLRDELAAVSDGA